MSCVHTLCLPHLLEAGEALDCMVPAITESLEKGETVSLAGFGSFKVDQRAARKGKNPEDRFNRVQADMPG